MAGIVRHEVWELNQELARLQGEMDRLSQRSTRAAVRRGTRIFPSIIISTGEDRLVVRAEVPGMKLEDLDISVTGDTLTVQGSRTTGADLQGGWYHRRERQSGSFSRAVRLPADVDGEQAEATYVAGVLTVSLPLRQPAKPKQIRVQVAEG